MQIVIDIDESTYNYIMKYHNVGGWVANTVTNAILGGTLLPKGHERLIDADELDEDKQIMTTIFGESKYAVLMDDIRKIPTIIEADKAESEEV